MITKRNIALLGALIIFLTSIQSSFAMMHMEGMQMGSDADKQHMMRMGNEDGMSMMRSNEMMQNPMMKMMTPEMKNKKMMIMKKITAVLDDAGEKEFETMRERHMQEMMDLMKSSSGMMMQGNYKEQIQSLKEKHFADLQVLLSEHPDVYQEVSGEMDEMMQEMMKHMQTMHQEMQLPFLVQIKVDRVLKKVYTKLAKLSAQKRKEKIDALRQRLQKFMQGNMMSDSAKVSSKDMLLKKVVHYIYNQLAEKYQFPAKMMMDHGKMGMMQGEIFSQDVEGLPEVKKSKIVQLKDGDTYEMKAYAVKQEVGNRIVKRLSYNGMIPGPILQVEKGAKIKIKFTNNLDVETTVHSHGLRLDDSQFDGLPTTMGGEQKPMKPGESFTYELNFPDTGVFWYHPHIREDYTQEMGLYGNYHVSEDGYWSEVDKEAFLVLDDFSEDDVFYKDKVNKTLMGRFGNIMMINNDENYQLHLKAGEKTRLFFTNVANTRTFDLEIKDSAGKKQELKLVGGDVGRIQKEQVIDHQIISPAERYIVETVFNHPGTYTITSKGRKLGEIIVVGNDTDVMLGTLRDNSADYKVILDKLDYYLKKSADKKLRLTIGMKGMGEMRKGMKHMDGKGNMMGGNEEDMVKKEASLGGTLKHTEDAGIEREDDMAMMNKMSNDQMMEWKLIDEDTKAQNMDIDWKFKKGDFVKVEIYNDPKSMHPMQHPIHFHGQRFVVLSRDGVKNTDLQWKDTTLVKNGEKIEILIEMTNPGIWMSHCHIAEHLQSGMMMIFKVEE